MRKEVYYSAAQTVKLESVKGDGVSPSGVNKHLTQGVRSLVTTLRRSAVDAGEIKYTSSYVRSIDTSKQAPENREEGRGGEGGVEIWVTSCSQTQKLQRGGQRCD